MASKFWAVFASTLSKAFHSEVHRDLINHERTSEAGSLCAGVDAAFATGAGAAATGASSSSESSMTTGAARARGAARPLAPARCFVGRTSSSESELPSGSESILTSSSPSSLLGCSMLIAGG